jgi:hypothetical protein
VLSSESFSNAYVARETINAAISLAFASRSHRHRARARDEIRAHAHWAPPSFDPLATVSRARRASFARALTWIAIVLKFPL